jgi:membrane protease YdiL (CAAX protease family)
MSAPVLRPLGLSKALICFGVPTLYEYLVIWHLLPRMDRAGISPFLQFAAFGSTMLLLLGVALVAYRREGHPWTWRAFRDRMRLADPQPGAWGWALGLALGGLALYIGASYAVSAILPAAPFPETVGKLLGGPDTFLGQPLRGGWHLLGAWFLFYLGNVIGEELWWRGYLLPRQELAHGGSTWLVHGVLWAGFHLGFFATDFLVLLPTALAYAWVCQRRKSTLPALAAHGLLNAMAAIRIVTGILA